MKKSLLILSAVLVTCSVAAYSFWNKHETSVSCHSETENTNEFVKPIDKEPAAEFFYDVSSRFIATITKERINKATTIIDLVPANADWQIHTFRDVKIRNEAQKDQFAKGDDNNLTSEQINLLKSFDYSSNFIVEAFCIRKDHQTGKVEDQCFVYYITVVPEKQAEYPEGKDGLLYYLESNSKDEIKAVKQDKLDPGKLRFTVTKTGEVANVHLEATCGYKSIDKKMVQLIEEMPRKWNPAENAQGEKVDEEIVFFFGHMGC